MRFQSDIENWIREEKNKEARSRKGIHFSFDTNGFDDDFIDAASRPVGQTSQLKSIQMEVASAITSESIVPIAVDLAKRRLDEAVGPIGDMMVKIEALQHGLRNQPRRVADKTGLNSVADRVQRVINADKKVKSGAARDKLLNILPEEIVDEYLDGNHIYTPVEPSRVRVVSELRDRYYTIDSVKDDRVSPLIDSSMSSEVGGGDVDLIDTRTGRTIEGIEGYDTASIGEDGNIILSDTLRPGDVIIVEPRAVNPPKMPSRGSAKVDISEDIDLVIQDLKFESWACLISNTASWMESMWGNIKDILIRAIDVSNLPQRMLNTGDMGTQGFGFVQDIRNLRNLADKIASHGVFSASTLGIQQGLRLSTPPDKHAATETVCDYNHRNYCDINSRLAEIIPEVRLWSFQVEDLPEEINGMSTKEVMAEMSGYFDKIKDKIHKVDEIISGLKADVCAFISRKIKGRSKRVSSLSSALADIMNLIAVFPFSWTQNYINIDLFEKLLRKSGLTAALDSLTGGRIEEFLALDEISATYPGKVAKYLQDRSYRTHNPAVASRLRTMSRSAKSYAERKILGQKLRESFLDRFRQNRVLDNSEAIKNEAKEMDSD